MPPSPPPAAAALRYGLVWPTGPCFVYICIVHACTCTVLYLCTNENHIQNFSHRNSKVFIIILCFVLKDRLVFFLYPKILGKKCSLSLCLSLSLSLSLFLTLSRSLALSLSLSLSLSHSLSLSCSLSLSLYLSLSLSLSLYIKRFSWKKRGVEFIRTVRFLKISSRANYLLNP